jgi:hypothetical protein
MPCALQARRILTQDDCIVKVAEGEGGCASPVLLKRPCRLARPRTPPFHGDNMGSNPIGDTNFYLHCSAIAHRLESSFVQPSACFQTVFFSVLVCLRVAPPELLTAAQPWRDYPIPDLCWYLLQRAESTACSHFDRTPPHTVDSIAFDPRRAFLSPLCVLIRRYLFTQLISHVLPPSSG